MFEPKSDTHRLRVTHVVQNMNVGGLEKLVAELIKRCDRQRFASQLICLGDGGTLFQELKEQGYTVATMNKGDGIDFFLVLRMARQLRRSRTDIVHCHNWNPLVYGGLGGRLARCHGVIYTAHGPEIPTARRRVILQRLPVADRITTVSEHVRQSAITKGGFRPANITTILNGIDVERFGAAGERERVRSEIGVSKADVVLGVVARLSPEKDHGTLLNAFKLVVERHKDTILVIVGDGELRRTLEERSVQLGLQDRVRFLGTRDDVPNVLSAFDVFVMSSKEEGLGITLLEAMAAGLPVVATAAGGIPEVVAHEETGLVVPIGDAQAFADAVDRMLSNREAAARMGEKGRKRVEKQFGIGAMVRRYETLYAEMAGRIGDK